MSVSRSVRCQGFAANTMPLLAASGYWQCNDRCGDCVQCRALPKIEACGPGYKESPNCCIQVWELQWRASCRDCKSLGRRSWAYRDASLHRLQQLSLVSCSVLTINAALFSCILTLPKVHPKADT